MRSIHFHDKVSTKAIDGMRTFSFAEGFFCQRMMYVVRTKCRIAAETYAIFSRRHIEFFEGHGVLERPPVFMAFESVATI